MKLVKPDPVTHSHLCSLEAKVGNLDMTVQKQVKMMENVMREQERAMQDQTMLLKRSFAEQSTQKDSMLTC